MLSGSRILCNDNAEETIETKTVYISISNEWLIDYFLLFKIGTIIPDCESAYKSHKYITSNHYSGILTQCMVRNTANKNPQICKYNNYMSEHT